MTIKAWKPGMIRIEKELCSYAERLVSNEGFCDMQALQVAWDDGDDAVIIADNAIAKMMGNESVV